MLFLNSGSAATCLSPDLSSPLLTRILALPSLGPDYRDSTSGWQTGTGSAWERCSAQRPCPVTLLPAAAAAALALDPQEGRRGQFGFLPRLLTPAHS